MGLTSGGLLLAVGTVLALLVVLSVLDWPRPRPIVGRLLVRILRVFGVGTTAVLLAALVLNNQYLFYTSWSDISGPTGHDKVHSIGDATAAQATVPGTGLSTIARPTAFPALPHPGQRWQQFTVTAPSLTAPVKVLVDLPPGYDPTSPRTYPVILGLHGLPANPSTFVSVGIPDDIARVTARRQLAPSIVVIPEITSPENLDSECVDGGPGQPQVDTWLSQDLPQWVVGHFSVRTDRLSWAALGYSYGGWCAASLGLRHPNIFGAAIVLMGYFRPDFAPDYRPNRSDLAQYDLVGLEKHAPVPISMWVATSREDTLSYPSTAQFLRAARAPTHVSAVVLPHGGHRIEVWQPLAPQAMAWLGQTLPGFHP